MACWKCWELREAVYGIEIEQHAKEQGVSED
jgi:hypothetical protein